MLDQMAGARAGEYPSDHHAMLTSEALNTLRAAQAVYEKAMSQNPQEVVDLSQEGPNRPVAYNSIAQRWSDSFGAPADTSTVHILQNFPVTEHGGYVHGGYVLVQSFPGEEPRCGIPQDTASRHEYQANADDSSLDNEQQREVLTFPEGESDAVTITERDLECLRPTRFLSNNIIDFYIEYLDRRLLSSEDRNRVYFFNSFFFTKLLGNNKACTGIDDQCKVDYEEVRKWSRGVNLFEKDYVFIPVLRSSHWSLIIICHLTTVSSSPGKGKGSPYVFHLDPFEGKHESFEDQVRSYLLQAWMERYEAANNRDQLLALFQMKYVQAQVPQQDNGYDCGLYLLHYVEVFLRESTSPNFSFAISKGGPHFTSTQFAADISVKRKAIERLILELGRTSKEQAPEIQNLSQELRRISQKLLICLDGKAMSGGRIEVVQSNGASMVDAQGDGSKEAVPLSSREIGKDNQHQQYHPETGHTDHPPIWKLASDNIPPDGVEIPYAEYQLTDDVALVRHRQPNRLPCAVLRRASKGTNKRGRNWTEDETSILLKCKVEGGRFCKENQGGTRWDIISEEIMARLGTMPSADQCRLRYDTLLKAYKTGKNYCLKTSKPFSEISEEERREWKLAKTLMQVEWYEAIDAICHQWPHKAKSRKRLKLSPSDDNGPCHPAPPTPATSPGPALARVPALISEPATIPAGSSKLENPLERQVAIPGFSALDEDLRSTLLNLILLKDRLGTIIELEVVYQRLAIVQDQKPSDIRRSVGFLSRGFWMLKLSELKLVNIEFDDEYMPSWLELFKLRVYMKFVEEVLRKNPEFDIFMKICDNYDSVSFPKAPLSLSLERELEF